MNKNEKNAKTQKENNHHHMRVNQAIIQVWNQSTIAYPWCDSHSTSISACGVWG